MEYPINKIVTYQKNIRKKYFDIYLNKIKIIIKTVIGKKERSYLHEPTLFGDDSKENIWALEIAFKQRQKQMKEGDIAQKIIGNFYGWEDLGIGHSSGLDCRKKNNTIIIDVKNKWNTCNSGSQKALFDKFVDYKKNNPQTRCVWGIVNPKPGCKILHEKIIYEGIEIEKIQGEELMKMVFTYGDIDYSTPVIHFVRQNMY